MHFLALDLPQLEALLDFLTREHRQLHYATSGHILVVNLDSASTKAGTN
jgi:hypothetical protein